MFVSDLNKLVFMIAFTPRFYKRHVKRIAIVLFGTMVYQMVYPLKALALNSGPSQPEFQGFAPISTSSLIDPFSGDFSYNVPILDIDGYPLNLVYHSTSNMEEEASWVGYGWNINVGTLNRSVRGLPDDMNGAEIKHYQNMKDRLNKSSGISLTPSISASFAANDKVGITTGLQATLGYTEEEDNYVGYSVGYSLGLGVYANVNIGPLGLGGNAGVSATVHSSAGATITPYAGFSVGLEKDGISVGLGVSKTRSFNTISGWGNPHTVGSFNIGNLSQTFHESHLNSISNEVPSFTSPFKTQTVGNTLKINLNADVSIGKVKAGLGVSAEFVNAETYTKYTAQNNLKGYGYMYSENAAQEDVLDYTRDNDGGINKDMPFMPPSMKTYDIFQSTAPNGGGTFRADRNDYGIVGDPYIKFESKDEFRETNEFTIGGGAKLWPPCAFYLEGKYTNSRFQTNSYVTSGGLGRNGGKNRFNAGKDLNMYFKFQGDQSRIDPAYFSQVGGYGAHAFSSALSVKGNANVKRPVNSQPISVFTNKNIEDLPRTVVDKDLYSYKVNKFPNERDTIARKTVSNVIEDSKIGAIITKNTSGQSFVYGTPANNHIKNEVSFRMNKFNQTSYDERNGILKCNSEADIHSFNGQNRDELYKNTLTPGYAHSYLLNAVLSPDYVDVTNDGITDDDLGSYVKFTYTKTENDYRWRIPYGDTAPATRNTTLLNQGTRATAFDDMASFSIGSKEIWYAHSMESKNYVVEFYLSKREDALDSRNKVIRPDHPNTIAQYASDKDSFSRMMRLDSIKYFSKHDRLLNKDKAVPVKSFYFSYDYGISSQLPNSISNGGKLRLNKVTIRNGDEPMTFADVYDFGYSSSNPAYEQGAKDGWGNYCPNTNSIPLCEFPYINQFDRAGKDEVASAFHLNRISLPSGGKIDIEYEADDYSYVQDKRAMAFYNVKGVGMTQSYIPGSVFGLYLHWLMPNLFIYVDKPAGLSGDYKNTLLNGSDMMYFSFNVNIVGNAFRDLPYDQVKGYAVVQNIDVAPNDPTKLFIQLKPVSLTRTPAQVSPITNVAINNARMYASDQLYYQQRENPDGKNANTKDRLKKASKQLMDAVLGQNSIKELMEDFSPGRYFDDKKSFVKLAMIEPKIGGGSRVKKLTFNDQWNKMVNEESSGLIGYQYTYKDENGLSSGVASYEPLNGGEENPLRSGRSYQVTNNKSNYPPYDPIELLKEDPVGESFYPTGSVGYSTVTIESIHKDYARSAQSKQILEFYTNKDFPFISTYSPKSVVAHYDQDFGNPSIREILSAFTPFKISNKKTSSYQIYNITQSFVIETNDMHGKQKAIRNYRLLPKNGKTELVNATTYYYNTTGANRLNNEVPVIVYASDISKACPNYGGSAPTVYDTSFPKKNLRIENGTLGVNVDVSTDYRSVVNTEERRSKAGGAGLAFCIIPPYPMKLSVTLVDDIHTHTDYFFSTITTKIVNRYGILKAVKSYNEGAEFVLTNKYYDPITGNPVVQVKKDKFGDDVYETTIPGYWTNTDLEPSYMEFPLSGTPGSVDFPYELTFRNGGGGYFDSNTIVQSSFNLNSDIYHRGDILFVYSRTSKSSTYAWHRLYVIDVTTALNLSTTLDALNFRYGNGLSNKNDFTVYVSPYKTGNLTPADLNPGDKLEGIQQVFKYVSGRKNMLNVSAGKYVSYYDPLLVTDSVRQYNLQQIVCWVPNFAQPSIDAAANNYVHQNSAIEDSFTAIKINPVSSGMIGQPQSKQEFMLFGNRYDGGGAALQRQNGTLQNWYYWLPSKYDVGTQTQLLPLMKHYDNATFNAVAQANPNAAWYQKSVVTKSVPGYGGVEETNPLGIYSSIILSNFIGKLNSAVSNARYGQAWVETFEDYRNYFVPNGITNHSLSPFYHAMAKSDQNGYKFFNKNQTPSGLVSGNFTLDSLVAHTGIYSVKTNASTTISITPKVNNKYFAYGVLPKVFNFALDSTVSQKYTVELWGKSMSSAPYVSSSGTYPLAQVSPAIDGWTLYRTTVSINPGTAFSLTIPSGCNFDDLRVYPALANVKTYVYHPFKNYLMAVLDENNYASLYEYNLRNDLVRLKKETEKGVITVQENIVNRIKR